MSPSALDREEVAVEQVQTVSEGMTARVIPSSDFGNVALDPQFTGTASQGAGGPYFSQLQNLIDMVEICTPYAPSPVDHRIVFVSLGVAQPFPLDAPVMEGPEGSDSDVAYGYIVVEPDPVAEIEPPEEIVAASEVVIEAAPQLDLAEVAEQMRDLVDLPVQDIARMAGIGRRQYYNLMRGKATSMRTTADERRFHLLHRLLSELHRQVGDPRAVRGAVLMPVEGLGFRSFMEVAAESADALQPAYDALAVALSAGETSRRRPLPPSAKMPADDERLAEAADFLRDYRPGDE
jgi:hypothetical protein